MSAVATDERPVATTPPPARERSAPRLFEAGELSLEDLVLDAWEGLIHSDSAGCPVCAARMTRDGACEGCGSELY